MKYLLDTCTISDFVKGDPNTLAHIKETSPSLLAVSTLTLMEIRYGLDLTPQRAEKIKTVISHFLAIVFLFNNVI